MNMLPESSEPMLPLSEAKAASPQPASECPAQPGPNESPSAAAGQAESVCRIFGIGTAGLNLLECVAHEGIDQSNLAAVHSDPRALAGSCAQLKVHLESRLTRGMGSAGDPERGRIAAEERLPRLKQICENTRLVLLVAGLGGGAATGITPVLAKVAKEAGAHVVVFAVLPFECEGNLRTRLAQAGLQELLGTADLVVCHSNQKTMASVNDTTSLADTFKISNTILAKTICTAWQACISESVMGMPFRDLCLLIQQRSSQAVLPVAEATGPGRIDLVVDQVLDHSLLGGRGMLCKAEAIAVLIDGGPDLSMLEVNRLMDRVQSEAGGTPVMMGVTVSPEAKARLRVGLLVAQPESVRPSPGTVQPPAELSSGPDPGEPDIQMVDRIASTRHPSRFVPPPPPTTPERVDQVRRHRKQGPRMRQGQLPLEIVSKGRFEKSEPTIHQGEDLDIPTYIRRHVSLN